MKYNYKLIDKNPGRYMEISLRDVYHQAGHAAAIHFGNLRKQLPPVHFQITIKQHEPDNQKNEHILGIYNQYIVKIEGGRLIQFLPLSISEATQNFTWYQQAEYQCAFEADVINLLAAALAEAKYVASRDNEPFNANLINLTALGFYGSCSDFELIEQYMQCFMPDNSERKRKLKELFLAAFSLVNDCLIWHKIKALAEFIREQPIGIIPCEELISLLNSDVNFSKVEPLAQQKMSNKMGHFIQTNTQPV